MPVIFLALTFLEVNSIFSTLGLYALGATITAARLSHAAHLTSPGTFGLPFRVFGFISTVVYCVITGVLISLAGIKVKLLELMRVITKRGEMPPCTQYNPHPNHRQDHLLVVAIVSTAPLEAQASWLLAILQALGGTGKGVQEL